MLETFPEISENRPSSFQPQLDKLKAISVKYPLMEIRDEKRDKHGHVRTVTGRFVPRQRQIKDFRRKHGIYSALI